MPGPPARPVPRDRAVILARFFGRTPARDEAGPTTAMSVKGKTQIEPYVTPEVRQMLKTYCLGKRMSESHLAQRSGDGPASGRPTALLRRMSRRGWSVFRRRRSCLITGDTRSFGCLRRENFPDDTACLTLSRKETALFKRRMVVVAREVLDREE